MLNRALLLCRNKSDREKKEFIRKLCRLFSETPADITTTELSIARNRLLSDILKDDNPAKDLKAVGMRTAERVYKNLEACVAGERDATKRFRKALLIALAGNMLEFGPMEHSVDLENLENDVLEVVNSKPAVDEIDRIYKKIKKSKRILYVTDNAPEIVLDRIFIRELLRYAEVVVAPLSKPIQDDACIEDAKKAGIDRLCRLVPRGDNIGIWFDRFCTKGFLDEFEKADFVIAKGMGCYETLIEYPERITGKVAILMKVKCSPVARNISAERGSMVAKIF